MRKNNMFVHGVSLIEILIVVGIFAVLGILSTRAIMLTLQGSKKGENQVKVRENVNYALSIVERQLKNAESIDTCPNVDTTIISYKDRYGVASTFSCLDLSTAGYIASGSSRLTTDELKITSCSFVCNIGSASSPPWIDVDLVAVDNNESEGKSKAEITVSSRIDLRTY